MEVGVLRQGLITEVREAFELVLVDLLDNGVFYQGEHRLLTGEVLVKIVDVSFGFLWMEKEKVIFQDNNTQKHTCIYIQTQWGLQLCAPQALRLT